MIFIRIILFIGVLLFPFPLISNQLIYPITKGDNFSSLLSIYTRSIENNINSFSTLINENEMNESTEVNVILHGNINRKDLEELGVKIGTSTSNWVTARVNYLQLQQIKQIPNITWIEMGVKNDPLCAIANSDSTTAGGWKLGNGASLVHQVYDGTNVLFGIIDTGVDWAHLDFRNDANPTQSRILFIWDMVTPPGNGRFSPIGFNYGVEFNQSHINNELDGTPEGYVVSMSNSSHGTTVAGISVGDGSAFPNNGLAKGVAPKANLLVVRVNQSTTAEIIDGVNWLMQKANQLGRPIVVNISLGGHFGAHDGSRTDEQYISSQSGPGKIFVIAAGNSGNSNIHAQGTVNTTQSTTFNVPSSTTAVLIDVWYKGGDAYIFQLTNPTGTTLSFNPMSDNVGNYPNNDYAEVYNGTETIAPITNGDGRIVLYIADGNSSTITGGTWTMTLQRVQFSGNGTWDAWVAGTAGGSVVFTSNQNTLKTLTMPATATNAISVANYSGGGIYIDINGVQRGTSTLDGRRVATSSRGPTRTGGQKPEISAVGNVARTTRASSYNPGNSQLLPGGFHYVSGSGTSFAAPHVAGAVVLMLQKWNLLNQNDVKSKLINSATLDTQTGPVWNDSWGFGKLYIPNALQTITKTVQPNVPITFGNTSTTLTFTTLPSGQWNVTVDRISQTPQNIGSHSALPFYYSITSSLPNFNFSTTIEIQYTNQEVGSLDENVLTICYFDGLNWIPLPNQMRFPNENKVRATTDHFTDFGVLDSEEGTLPVQLTSFQAVGEVGRIRITWKAESEIDLNYWILEKRERGYQSFTIHSITPGIGQNVPHLYNVFDYQVIPAKVYEYRLTEVTADGEQIIYPSIVSAASLERQDLSIPSVFEISKVYPNPFNLNATFRIRVPYQSELEVYVVDILGNRVANISKEHFQSGEYQFEWNAKHHSSGIYFLVAKMNDQQVTKKIVLMK
ncbi:MAG: S8 family peptidase [bacterium]|nr:S8 family peptidase [bacterium]